MFVGFGCWFGLGGLSWCLCLFLIWLCVGCFLYSLFIWWLLRGYVVGWCLVDWFGDCLIELLVACLDLLFCYCGYYGLCFGFG